MLHLEIRTHWWSRVPRYPGGAMVNIQVPSTRGCVFLLEQPLDTLRPRGHNYALPMCHSMLHKKSFIVNCLYRFVGVGPLSPRPVIPKGRYPQREMTNQMSVVLYLPKLGLGIKLGSGSTTKGEANCTNNSISIRAITD